MIGHTGVNETLASLQAKLKVLQESAMAARGNVVVLRCPPSWKTSLPIWGAPREDGWLMRAIKDKLDTRRLFNPGRFVDGI